MLKILIKFVFTIISKLFSLILSPIVLVITSLFPNISTIASNTLTYFNTYAFSTITFFIKVLEHLTFLPHTLIVFLLDYLLIKYTIYLSVIVVKFAIQVYNKLKV